MLLNVRPLCPLARCLLFFTFFTLLSPFGQQIANAQEQNTAFLPLQIHAAQPDDVRREADALLARQLTEHGFFMLSRIELDRYSTDTDRQWPPKKETLGRLAEDLGYDAIAVGSVTQIGSTLSVDFSVFDALSRQFAYSDYLEATIEQAGEPNSEKAMENAIAEMLNAVYRYTNRQFTIASIAPEGNQRIDSGAILQKIQTQPGSIYDPARLRDDLRAVFSMGYFDNVEIDATDSPEGKKIIFRVTEKPLIGTVIIDGNDELSEEKILEAANIPLNNILNPSKINLAVERIKDLYKKKGFYNTEIETKISYPRPESAEVRLIISEGVEVAIREISFDGNTSFDDDELEDVIQTDTYAWWISWLNSAGNLNMETLKQDAARVNAFYHNHGFIEAKVGDPRIDREESDLFVTFPIQEGPRYRVGTVTITGDLIKDKQEIMALLKIRNEAFLSRQIVQQDTTRITDLYAENGYAFAEVTPRVTKSVQGKRVNITLRVDQGPLVYFNRVNIVGNTRTRDNVIRRDIAVEEGQLFNSKAIRTSTQRLKRLGFFEEVNITPKPTVVEDQMDVEVSVIEQPTGNFSIGAGYSSTESLMVMGEIAENNIFGTGNQLSLASSISGTSNKYNIKFTNPRIFDSQVSGGADLFKWEYEYTDYTKKSTGAALRLGHPFFKKWRINYVYRIEDTELTDISEDASQIILMSKDINLVSSVGVSLVRDTRNSGFAPSSGSRNSLSVRYAGGPLGGDAAFTKVEASSSWWFPLPWWDNVFHIKGAAGQAFENEDDKLPVYEHFYLGGMNSIRGFKSSSISPIDADSEEKIGGDKMWYANISYIFPLLKDFGMQGEIFTDLGNVYATWEDWDISNYKHTAGVGILWMSPLGPLRIAWGYNLDRKEGEDSSNWDFTMGGAF